MNLRDFFTELFSGPKVAGRRRYMEAGDYQYLNNEIRLLDDRGRAVKEEPGSPYFVAMTRLAEAVYQASPHLGDEGIDQVVGWLEKARGPGYFRKDEFGQELYGVALNQYQVDSQLNQARLRIATLNRQLVCNDSYAEAVERNSLMDLVDKIAPFESEDNKRQFGAI
jgi:hypothetical protein